jgi:hypothetical protein
VSIKNSKLKVLYNFFNVIIFILSTTECFINKQISDDVYYSQRSKSSVVIQPKKQPPFWIEAMAAHQHYFQNRQVPRASLM